LESPHGCRPYQVLIYFVISMLITIPKTASVACRQNMSSGF
jgi:hypothetical protein